MGYVLFAYRPDSWWHRIGMAAQGIAPLIAGACITSYALDLQPYAPEAVSAQSLAEWLWSAASTPLPALWALLEQGAHGILLVVLVVCVSQHAIPSIADMRIGWKGTSALLLLFIVLSALAFWLFGAGFVIPSHLPVLRHLFLTIEHWLWCLAFGVVGIITITVSTAVFLLFIPSLILRFLSMATQPKE